ncbi:MAG: DMT family transporter [Rhodobacteraceae bacterium]|nr:DMT family transporter [Paracoccaceae bacterium]
MTSSNVRGSLEMTAAMLISGTIGWFVLHSGLESIEVVFWRCAFGAIALTLICALLGAFKLEYLTPKRLMWAALCGVAIVLNWVLLFASYEKASIGLATVVYNSQPLILTVLGALFLKDRPGVHKMTWLVVAFAGVSLLVSNKPSSNYLSAGEFEAGLLLALGAAVLYAVAALLIKKLSGVPPYLIALIQVCIGLVILAPMVDFSHIPTSSTGWGSLVLLGFLHTGIMYVLLYDAIQKLPTPMVAALSYIYPIAAVAVDMVAFDASLSVLQVVGSLVVILAAAGVSLNWRIWPQRPKQPCLQQN